MHILFKKKLKKYLTIFITSIVFIYLIINLIDATNIYIYKYKCYKADDYNSILECIDRYDIPEETILKYLQNKETVLKNINLIEEEKNPYNNLRILRIYSSLDKNEEDIKLYLDILEKNLNNDEALYDYIKLNKKLTNENKIKLIQEFLAKNGIRSNEYKTEKCIFNKIYTNYIIMDELKFVRNGILKDIYKREACYGYDRLNIFQK